jgi:eukaryotic-like serine/threonine-protein kinase
MEQKISSSMKEKVLSKKFFKRILLGLLVLFGFLLLMDFVIMPLYTKHNWEYELPDVTDRPVTEAIEILDSCGFVPLIKDSVYDEKFSPGSVIQQNPLPFSKVKSGRRVYLIISIGEKPIYVPALIGLTPQDAEFRLREQELNLNQVFYEFSDFYPRGVVISQSLPAGEVAQKNQRVNITVSLGVAPTSFEIPNLVGKSLETAEKELEAIGVKITKVKYSYRPQLVPGTILNQSLEAGTNAAKVESISLLVSTDQPPLEESKEDTIIGKIGE